MNHKTRRTLAAALSMPAAIVLSYTPSASAATILAVEGTLQPSRTTQKAFSGQFCSQNTCRSINNARTPFDVKPGSRQLQAAVDATQGDVILMGFSLGAASIYDRMREWERNPDVAPDPQRLVLIVTFGNPENKYGGDDRKNFYAGLPGVQPYQHLDVTMQYDSVADRPTRWGWYSAINASFSRHMDYFKPSYINDPDNLIYQDEDGTTYMLIKAEVLPMLKWMDWFTSDERMAELDAKYRPLIEADYDRPDYIEQGEGADWGNGNPPPSVTDDAEDALPLTAESDGDAATSAQEQESADGIDGTTQKLVTVDPEEVVVDDEAGELTNDDEAEADRGASPGSATLPDVGDDDGSGDEAGADTDADTDADADTDPDDGNGDDGEAPAAA